MTLLSNDASVRAALWLSVFVTAFNVMTVVALLPNIVRDLETTIGTGQTALVLLALVTAVASPAEEYLGEIYGRRRVYRVGLVLFATGLLITFSGATSLALLLGLSVVTGLGAAVLVTAPFVAIADRSDLPESARRRRTGELMLALTAGALAGPVFAGLIATGIGSRWAFVPQLLMVAVIVWLASALPAEARRGDEPVDWVGTALVLAAFGCVVVGLGLGGEYGWWRPKEPFQVAGVTIPPLDLSIAPALIAAGVVVAVAAVAWAFRKRRTGGHPGVWRLRPLGDAQLILFVLAVLLLAALDTGIAFALYTYLPIAADLSTMETVVLLLPKTGVALLIGAWLVYRGTARLPGWLVTAGFTALAVGASVLASIAGESPSFLLLILALVVIGAGVSLAGRGLFTTAGASTTGDRPAGSLFVSGSDLGAALGVAVFGAILISVATLSIVGVAAEVDLLATSDAELEQIADELEDGLLHLSESEAIALAADIEAVEPVERAVRSSVADAMRVGFLAMTAVSITGIAISLVLWRRQVAASDRDQSAVE